VEYKCSRFYDPGDELGITWNDPRLAIEWPLDDPVLSVKDAAAPTLTRLRSYCPFSSYG
jgi:dTDP-4-dehydrorhamnose 3,5-epimerase